MLDDLRSSATYQDDDEEEEGLEQKPEAPRRGPRPARPAGNGRILGMTAQQRFIVATLLFILVCIAGAAMLLATGAVSLPLY